MTSPYNTERTDMNRAAFYAALRKRDSGLFGTSLSQGQVGNLEILLDEGTKRGLPVGHLAYALATAYHEVGSALNPISENLNYSTAARIRAVWPSRFPSAASAQPYVRNPAGLANKVYSSRMGNGPEASGEGWKFRGRGYVQITGKINYERGSSVVGVDLVNNPDKAMEPRIAALLMFDGMVRGTFTGRRLSDFINGRDIDYMNARAIINGDVKANGAKIAGYARSFERALLAAGYEPGKQPVAPDEPPKPVPAPTPAPTPQPAPAAKLEPKRALPAILAIGLALAAAMVAYFTKG
jgi:putative chitinase